MHVLPTQTRDTIRYILDLHVVDIRECVSAKVLQAAVDPSLPLALSLLNVEGGGSGLAAAAPGYSQIPGMPSSGPCARGDTVWVKFASEEEKSAFLEGVQAGKAEAKACCESEYFETADQDSQSVPCPTAR